MASGKSPEGRRRKGGVEGCCFVFSRWKSRTVCVPSKRGQCTSWHKCKHREGQRNRSGVETGEEAWGRGSRNFLPAHGCCETKGLHFCLRRCGGESGFCCRRKKSPQTRWPRTACTCCPACPCRGSPTQVPAQPCCFPGFQGRSHFLAFASP